MSLVQSRVAQTPLGTVNMTLHNVPVKSKLQHPPRVTPRAFEFLGIFCSNPPSSGRKAVQMPHPRENYQITVLTFQ